jgi:predicted transposase YdaD
VGTGFHCEQLGKLTEGISAMILGIRGIEESTVYQGIFAEGEAKGRLNDARKLFLVLATDKLGSPGEQVLDEVNSLADIERLHALARRIRDVSSWEELLASPST